MIYFLGNCQADFVSRTLADKGYDCTYRVLASPLTYTSHPGSIPTSLATITKQHALTDYFLGRELTHQFLPVTTEDKPELIVLSLFHENTPLFIHNDDDYIFYMDTNALSEKPEMMQWAQDNCRMFNPNPASYLDRYGKMLQQLRKDVPNVPIIIISRLSHYPAFGPDPFSYLDEWEKLWQPSKEILQSWATELDNVHILEMDRIFGGIWSESDTGIDTHCPFLKIKLEETNGEITGLHAQRDIEHIGPMPAKLADKISQFIDIGKLEYDKAETVPHEWRRQWKIRKLDDETMLKKLNSGANYLCAEAIASFFLDLSRDYTELLVQARDRMPICHMTLHMIKAYSRIWCNQELNTWCDTHRLKAERFLDNGPIYRDVYLKRIDAITEHLGS